jgi:prophage antirepressor-like protein
MNKLNALSGQGLAHSEIGQSVNCRELKFHDQVVIPYDNGDGKIWFTAKQAAELLGYAQVKAITNLYHRNKDEFTEGMSKVINVMTNGINNNLRRKKVRVFSPRGLHLLGFLADTQVAKEVRKWALDLIEKESSVPQLNVHHTIEQMRNIVAVAWKASDEDSSDAGRRLRKRQDDLPELVKAQKLVDEIGQIPFELIGGGKVEVSE